MNIILAIIIGFLFGFVLQKAGAANPQRIVDMLRLKNLHLMKTILFAIGFSSLILFLLMTFGIIENIHISVKTAYIGVIIGGGILGLGWVISGFCPGTGVVAAGAGRKDSLFFIIGGLIGALVFTLMFEPLSSTFVFAKIGGGKATLAATNSAKYITLIPEIPSIVVAGGIAIVFILIAFRLPNIIKSSK
jgi:uncharacterized membrane protein YedE/YeeE